MATIKISTFGGIVPAADDRLLPENSAALAKNVWLYSGALQGFREKEPVHGLTGSKSCSAFRIPFNFPDNEHIGSSFWMEFPSSYVDVIRTAVVNDRYERYYWAQQTLPPRYNTRERILAGLPAYLLGIPAPGYTPTLSATDGSTLLQARSYLVTWVSAFGEEGPPCPPATATGYTDGVWTLNGLVPPDEPERNIVRARIYRTITSLQGIATYFFVAEVDVSTTSYVDSSEDVDIVVNRQLESTTWTPPPDDLEGWVTMPNGIIAGWRDCEVWFSEAYRPHAWPVQYAVATEFEIIGLGVAGQTLVVCTQGYPTAITGINPASMSMAKVTTFEPCVSRGSIVSTPEGVYYASPNGLILAANGAFLNITSKYITKDKWQSLLRLPTMRAARLGTGYYAHSTGTFGAFAFEGYDDAAFAVNDDFDGAHSGLFVDPQNPATLTTLCSDTPMLNVFNDAWSGELMTVDGGSVNWVNVQNDHALMQPYVWRSKIFQGNFVDNFEAMKVFFDPDSYDPCGTLLPPPNKGRAFGSSFVFGQPVTNKYTDARGLSVGVSAANAPTTVENYFTYVIIEYDWSTNSDLDIRHKITVPVVASVGWAQSSSVANYLYWGGDNVGRTPYAESVYINLNTAANYGQYLLMELRAYWYNPYQPGIGGTTPVTVKITLSKGGGVTLNQNLWTPVNYIEKTTQTILTADVTEFRSQYTGSSPTWPGQLLGTLKLYTDTGAWELV